MTLQGLLPYSRWRYTAAVSGNKSKRRRRDRRREEEEKKKERRKLVPVRGAASWTFYSLGTRRKRRVAALCGPGPPAAAEGQLGDEEPEGLNPEEEERRRRRIRVSIIINVLFAPVDPAEPGSGLSTDTQLTTANANKHIITANDRLHVGLEHPSKFGDFIKNVIRPI